MVIITIIQNNENMNKYQHESYFELRSAIIEGNEVRYVQSEIHIQHTLLTTLLQHTLFTILYY